MYRFCSACISTCRVSSHLHFCSYSTVVFSSIFFHSCVYYISMFSYSRTVLSNFCLSSNIPIVLLLFIFFSCVLINFVIVIFSFYYFYFFHFIFISLTLHFFLVYISFSTSLLFFVSISFSFIFSSYSFPFIVFPFHLYFYPTILIHSISVTFFYCHVLIFTSGLVSLFFLFYLYQ